MRTIAVWSHHNKIAARILIAICHVCIIYLGCYAGLGLKQNQVFLSPAFFWISISIFPGLYLLFSRSYPLLSFNKRKLLDSVIVLSSFIMVISFSNQKDINHFIIYNSLNGSFDQSKVKAAETPQKQSFKQLKKQYKELRKTIKRGKVSTGNVVLAIIAGIGLGIILAAGACSLACNGQDTLAIIVLAGGLTAIFFICRAIIGGRKKTNAKFEAPYSKPIDD